MIKIGANFSMEEFRDDRFIPELLQIYKNNFDSGILPDGIRTEYFRTTFRSREFAFGYIGRSREKPIASIFFAGLREGVLLLLDGVIDKDYPYALAASAKKLGALTISKAAELGFRKIEAKTRNPIVLKGLPVLGYHTYYAVAGLAYFETYLPSIFSIREVADDVSGENPYFQLNKNYFRIVSSYRKSLEVSAKAYKFRIPKDGIFHEFTIDRLSEGCTALKKEDEFAVSCKFSSQIAIQNEPINVMFLIKNLSSYPKSFRLSSHYDEGGELFPTKACKIDANKTIRVRTFADTSRCGLHQLLSDFQIGNKIASLRTALYVIPPVQIDYSTNSFIHANGKTGKIDLKFSNVLGQERMYDLKITGSRGLILVPEKSSIVVAPKSYQTKTFAVRSAENRAEVKSIKLEITGNSTARKLPNSRTEVIVNYRIRDKKEVCIGNKIDDCILLNDDQIRIFVNLKSGLIQIKPIENKLYHIFNFWDDIGPPFSEFGSFDWSSYSDQEYADIYRYLPRTIAPLRSAWKREQISARLLRNTIDEAEVELIEDSARYRIRKRISLTAQSLVRFQTEISIKEPISGEPVVLRVRPCFVCQEGTNLYVPLKKKQVPFIADIYKNKYSITEVLGEGFSVSENWVCYTFEKLGHSFGLFWDGNPHLDFLHFWYPKLPWLSFTVKGSSSQFIAPDYYFWAGNRKWQDIREIANNLVRKGLQR